MPKNNEEKYCLCITDNDNDFEFWNADDISQGVGKVPVNKDFPEFEYDGFILINTDALIIENDTVIGVLSKNVTSVIIPDSVIKIGEDAFRHCRSLKSVAIPDSVTKISEGAFDGCVSLSSITIPNSVTEIGNYAFNYCDSLSSVTILDSVTKIGNYAFCGCKSLKSINIPNSVIEIGNYAFSKCVSLKLVTISNSVTQIGYGVFEECNKLTIKTNNNYVIDYCKRKRIPYKPLQTNENINNKNPEVFKMKKIIRKKSLTEDVDDYKSVEGLPDDLWSQVYNSLATHINDYQRPKQFRYINKGDRYQSVNTDYDGNIVVKAHSLEDFDLAIKVAEYYNLKYIIRDYNHRDWSRDTYFPYTITIYIPEEGIIDKDN